MDKEGRHYGSACAFVDSRGLVVTNRHCIEGAVSLRLNLGSKGLFDLPVIRFDSDDLDIVALEGDFPAGELKSLAWESSLPRKYSPVTVVVRDGDGVARQSSGRSGECIFDRSGALGLSTSAPAWLGTSGAPLVDARGRVIGVVNRLGDPMPGQPRSTAQAALAADVLALKDTTSTVATWKDGGQDAERSKLKDCERAAMDLWSTDPPRALHYARAALAIRPKDVRLVGIVSSLLDRMGKNDDAVAAMEALVTSCPESWMPTYFLGRRAFILRLYSEAIRWYERSLKIHPQAITWFWMGTALWWQRDMDRAVSAFEESVRLEPRHARSWEGLARLYSYLKRTDDLVRVAERRRQADPDDPSLLAAVASAQLQAGLLDQHKESVARLRDVNPYLANRATIPPRAWDQLSEVETWRRV
jgi:tetratricopeptide (TPR) repeat protein